MLPERIDAGAAWRATTGAAREVCIGRAAAAVSPMFCREVRRAVAIVGLRCAEAERAFYAM
jgi:hypothetical protein